MQPNRPDRNQVSQDGFSAMVEGTARRSWRPEGEEQPAQAMPRQAEIPQKLPVLEAAANADGTFTVVRCLNPNAFCIDIEREVQGTVTAIAPRAFEGAAGLTVVRLPKTLTAIGERAFADCRSLREIVIPGNVVKVGTLSFARCHSLTRVRIEAGVQALGPSCFSKCPALLRADLPSTVSMFGGGVFFGSKSVCICGREGTPAHDYAVRNGIPFDAECWRNDELLLFEENEDGSLTVTGCRDPRTEILEIPAEVCGRKIEAVAPKAFFNMQSLRSLTIRGKLREIGGKAFFGCSSLTALCMDEGAECIGDSAFTSCTGLESVILPRGTLEVGDYAFFGCSRLAFVKMPPVARIRLQAFDGCSPLLRVYGGVVVGRNP